MPDGRSAASSKGMPSARIVPEVVPCESNSQQEADEGIRLALPAIIDALTRPLSAEEAHPTPKVKEPVARIVFQEIGRAHV